MSDTTEFREKVRRDLIQNRVIVESGEEEARAWLRKYWADTRHGTDIDYTCLDVKLQCELLAAYAAHREQQRAIREQQ